ncbi:MAG TPA: hypothetical protein VK463_20425 [Desulfomonilaceae bacterium]|nr:hypothetical protein [Desulfomonilaceae bacterium]
MDQKQSELLEGVLRQIGSKDFLKDMNGVEEWRGADVIVRRDLNDRLKNGFQIATWL